MRGRRPKISAELSHELLQVYLHMGLHESRKLCIKYGMSPDYAAKRASEMGLSYRRIYSGNTTRSGVNHADHRWRWAAQRGEIVA